MRLITVDTGSGTRAAVQVGEAFALVPGAFEDVGALLRAGEAGLEAARRAHDDAGNGATALNGAVLRRPVLNPEAVICVGLNYRTHIEEMGRELPTAPTLFTKLARALTDPFADIPIPAVTRKMDYEGELAVVIGKRGRFITREQAWDHVAGVSVLNDVTARDHQNRTIQWWAGKSFEATTPLGPALVTLDEVGDVGALELRLTVNGEERQRAMLDDLVFDVPALIEDISQIVSLEPGDVISTGSPGGVGMASERFLHGGDVVEVSIDRVGSIRNVFRGTA
jgi:acylpyruvate hydrolase